MKAITEMHHTRIRGKIIYVGEAKYRRAMGEENTETRKGDRVRTALESRELQKGESSTRMEEAKKIEPSKSSGTTSPIDFKSLWRVIVKNFPQFVEVRELGAYKALLVFDSVKNAEEAFTFKMNSFLQFFYSVWRWEESERSETRRVWLECHGMPLHVCVGYMLIDICVFDVINEWIHITVGTSGFDVFVKEIGREIYGD
ncbi:hypothetical protein AHAS_Ahas04G0137700 [Arachis hypogaea]